MPFTPTHVVAVVPLWPVRRFVPFTALAVGSMVPDLPLFFPFIGYGQTHSPTGALTICLPIGGCLFLLFELVMRRPLIALLPTWVACRLPTGPNIPTEPKLGVHLRYFVGVALSIVLGAYSHQIWDAFTHQDRWGTRLVPALDAQFELGGFNVRGFKLLQYGSTVIGLPALALLALWALSRTTPIQRQSAGIPLHWKLSAWSVSLAIPIGVGVFAFTMLPTAYEALGVTIKRSGAIILTGLLVYCVLFHAFAHDRNNHNHRFDQDRSPRGA